MSNASDFVIENGVLKKYVGPGGDVVIPDGVTAIGERAFQWCSDLTSVTIPEGVTSIGDSAFSWCNGITSVTVPRGITSIENNTFVGCKSLKCVNLPDSLKSIGFGAFDNCSNLTSITIPNGVTDINWRAFYYCNSLTDITLPDSVRNVGPDAFYGCDKITIHVSATAANRPENFTIKNGMLTEYKGPGGDVVVPDGVTVIASRAFSCGSLKSLTLPESVLTVGAGAISGCDNISIRVSTAAANRPESFTIQNDTLTGYNGPGGDVIVPEGVTSIRHDAFRGCSSLISIVIPESVKNVEDRAFYDCKYLSNVTIPESTERIGEGAFGGCNALTEFTVKNSSCVFEKEVFGSWYPEGLISIAGTLIPHLSVPDIAAYILKDRIWIHLSADDKANLFLTKQGKSLEKVYQKMITDQDAAAIGKTLLSMLNEKSSAKDCGMVFTYLSLLSGKISAVLAKDLYEKLKTLKASAKTIAKIEADPILMELLGSVVVSEAMLPPAEQKVTDYLLTEKRSVKSFEADFKALYSIQLKDLPKVRYQDGNTAAPLVTAWLLAAHEKTELRKHWGKQELSFVVAYQQPGIRVEAEEILQYMDAASFQSMLRKLADQYLGLTGNSKKMFLAHPICRYADEDLLAELLKRAPKWRSSVSGNDAPPLRTFRDAILYRDDRAAMLFAEKYGDLKQYAGIRNITEDELRDQYLSDVGLAPDGTKQYDLGTFVVTAVMQPDFSFLIQLPNGKTAKSLPKKDADPVKYQEANKDFDELKKSAKKIVKNRFAIQFKDYLSGRERTAAEWKAAYETNPLLQHCATLVVWAQGNSTFILTKDIAIDSAEQPYTITDEPIKVAHPMEMKANDVAAWQKYFTSRGVKQPFAQVWEPVREPDEIAKDRYAGCMIPYYRFLNQKKHGISVEDYDFHNEIYILLEGCEAEIDRIDFDRHAISPNDRFEIRSFAFKRYTRQVNHLVAYFDRVTVWDRVRKDDLTVIEQLNRFTLAQITEFIAAAQEANANNVLAALLDYKNAHFADFDPMAEFTLDW